MRLILDTDIGDDIDDALALALILACPELQLLGVTTVFGNVQARSRQARTILQIAGERYAKIPVACGCSRGISHFLAKGLMSAFGDPDHLPNQDSTALPESALLPLDPRHGVEFLIDTLMQGEGDIIPVLIGAMTNVAMAIVKEPRVVPKVPLLAIMAGEFRRPMAEWNIRCDPEAASIIFNSGIPISLIPWHIGDVVQFSEEEINPLARSPLPICQNLTTAIKAWQDHHGPGDGIQLKPSPRLYDPMAVATLIQPELCSWKQGTVSVELRGEHTYGYTTFIEDANGRHRVAWDADRSASAAFYLDRVLGR